MIVLQAVSNSAQESDTLIRWAVAIGSILVGVIAYLFVSHKTEVKDLRLEITNLNKAILDLEKEHSKELREIYTKSTIVIERVNEIMKLYEYNKRQ